MNAQVRYGVAALCVAALAGLIGLFVSADSSASANGVFSAAMLVLALAGVAGCVLVLVGVLRAR